MKKEAFEKIKKETAYLAGILIFLIALFRIIFYNDSIAETLKLAVSLYFIFIIPGFSLMLYWMGDLSFPERFVISAPLSAALIGIFSYYIGLMGVHIKYTSFALPIAITALGIAVYWLSPRLPKENADNQQ